MNKCDNCGFEFDDEGIETIQYQEYPGARMQKDYVSACCHATYSEV
jgi:hypothetical protein